MYLIFLKMYTDMLSIFNFFHEEIDHTSTLQMNKIGAMKMLHDDGADDNDGYDERLKLKI